MSELRSVQAGVGQNAGSGIRDVADRTGPGDAETKLRSVLSRARVAQREWRDIPLADRRRSVKRMRAFLVAEADRLASLISEEVGKPRIDALATEVIPAALAVGYYARQARSHLRPRRLPRSSLLFINKSSRMHRVPFGVVAIFSPWNYPLGIPIHEIVPGLLAGNAVLFKSAPETPRVAAAIEQMVRAAGLPEGLFARLDQPAEIASEVLLAAEGADKLFFTGSVAVGKLLMERAARTLTPVSLELGGNDAMLVCADADLERAVGGALWAGLQNCGQSCGGVERIYVHRDAYQPFVELLAARVRELRIGSSGDGDFDMGPMCTQRQADRVREQIEDAVGRGARVYSTASLPSAEPQGLFVPATVLTEVDHDMQIMREETFGPVLCVMPVEDMDQAVSLANDSMLGLSASVWSRDRRRAALLGRQIHAGAITINDHLISHGLAETPWGGFKESGIGRTHGAFGFEEMTEPQVVVTELFPFLRRNVFWHPYSERLYRGLRGVLHLFCGRGLLQRLGGLWQTARIAPRMFRLRDN